MKQRNWRLYAFLVLSVIAVLVTAVLSVFLGSTDISWQTVLQALFAPDMSSHQQIAVVDLRLPRTLGDILVGAGLAVSGAIMQGVTRNPLADSGLLGINAGASFALAVCLAFLTHVSFGFTIRPLPGRRFPCSLSSASSCSGTATWIPRGLSWRDWP